MPACPTGHCACYQTPSPHTYTFKWLSADYEGLQETELGEALTKFCKCREVEIYLHIIHEMYATAYNKKPSVGLPQPCPNNAMYKYLVEILSIHDCTIITAILDTAVHAAATATLHPYTV